MANGRIIATVRRLHPHTGCPWLEIIACDDWGTTKVVTFRDETPVCLACESALTLHGDRWSCEQCGSALVDATSVEQMMDEMSPDDHRPIDQRLVEGTGTQRRCPRCMTVMSMWSLHGIVVDRCGPHGIWFDSGELMHALQNNAEAYNERHPRMPRLAYVPLGIGVIVGVILGPWLERRRLRKDIAATSPKTPKTS